MKPNITFTYHYMLFVGMALMLTQTTTIRPCSQAKEVKIEKPAKHTSNETAEVLHSEMLFRY